MWTCGADRLTHAHVHVDAPAISLIASEPQRRSRAPRTGRIRRAGGTGQLMFRGKGGKTRLMRRGENCPEAGWGAPPPLASSQSFREVGEISRQP